MHGSPHADFSPAFLAGMTSDDVWVVIFVDADAAAPVTTPTRPRKRTKRAPSRPPASPPSTAGDEALARALQAQENAAGPHDDGAPACAICMDDVGTGDARFLPCTHRFHVGCIDPWLAQRAQCPTCRADVPL